MHKKKELPLKLVPPSATVQATTPTRNPMKRAREPEDSVLPPSSPSSADVGQNDPVQLQTQPSVPLAPQDGPPTKFVDVDDGNGGAIGPTAAMITCHLHRDRVAFPSLEAYETHCTKEHFNRCLECRRNFPSLRYLGLHSDECHDPFVAVKRDRGEHTFACFVDGCDRKCASSDKRRRHLIDKHSFPKNFFFDITQHGIDGRMSLLDDGGRRRGGLQHHRRRSSAVASGDGGETARGKDATAQRRTESIHQSNTSGTPKKAGIGSSNDTVDGAAMDEDTDKNRQRDNGDNEDEDDDDNGHGDHLAEEDAPDVAMEDLSTAMSAISFVPRSVRFGRGRKAGFARGRGQHGQAK